MADNSNVYISHGTVSVIWVFSPLGFRSWVISPSMLGHFGSNAGHCLQNTKEILWSCPDVSFSREGLLCFVWQLGWKMNAVQCHVRRRWASILVQAGFLISTYSRGVVLQESPLKAWVFTTDLWPQWPWISAFSWTLKLPEVLFNFSVSEPGLRIVKCLDEKVVLRSLLGFPSSGIGASQALVLW